MPEGGKAFAKGSIGCIAAFFILAILAVAVGGQAHIDAGGFIMLIVIGGIIGLVVNYIYQKGKRDAGGGGDDES